MRRKIFKWIEENQGKHHCHCGCNQVIKITYNHAKNGIPKYLVGHFGRKHIPKHGYLPPNSKNIWVKENQGKYRCHCGCDEYIIITKKHYSHGIPKYIHGHQIRARPKRDEVERFWERVDKRKPNECWFWIDDSVSQSYGTFRSVRREVCNLAHRMSYLLFYGELPRHLDVLHDCDNKKCVNPHHLHLGTQKDNNKEALERGLLRSKYSVKNVLDAVKMIQKGVRKFIVAKQTGISQSDLWAIMSGKTWRHVTGFPETKRGR